MATGALAPLWVPDALMKEASMGSKVNWLPACTSGPLLPTAWALSLPPMRADKVAPIRRCSVAGDR